MKISRRALLGKALALTAAGILLPEAVAAEPERRVWAFPTNPLGVHTTPWVDFDALLNEAMRRAKLRLEREVWGRPIERWDYAAIQLIETVPGHGARMEPGPILIGDEYMEILRIDGDVMTVGRCR